MKSFYIQNYEYVDFHSHMHDEAFDVDRDEVMKNIIDKKIALVTIGTDTEESKKAKALSDKYENVFYTIGVHPYDLVNAEFREEEFEKLLGEKCIAIGECGLDYFYLKTDKEKGIIENMDREVDRQRELFIKQIGFAIKHNLPLMIHGRPSIKDEVDNPSGMDAYEDILDILRSYIDKGNKIKANMHFFAGSKEIARECVALGFTFSFGGVLTLTSDFDEVIKSIPIENIHAETDAPYVCPKNKDGKRVAPKIENMYRNSSEYVPVVVEKIAELKGLELEECKSILKNNFAKFLDLK